MPENYYNFKNQKEDPHHQGNERTIMFLFYLATFIAAIIIIWLSLR